MGSRSQGRLCKHEKVVFGCLPWNRCIKVDFKWWSQMNSSYLLLPFASSHPDPHSVVCVLQNRLALVCLWSGLSSLSLGQRSLRTGGRGRACKWSSTGRMEREWDPLLLCSHNSLARSPVRPCPYLLLRVKPFSSCILFFLSVPSP